jgi:hypothetical protein
MMAGLVALQVLFVDSKSRKQIALIIFQIFIINLSLVWSPQIIFPNLIGVDPWSHQMITTKILNSGFIPQGYSYSNLPLMHLEVASTSLITQMDYKFAAAFSISLSQTICCILFVFILGKYFFNTKIALLASLLLAIGNYFISMGIIAIPNTFGAIFILIILYLIFKLRMKNFFVGTSLILLFMITLILTHTVSSMCLAIILIVILLASFFYNKLYHVHSDISELFNLAAFFSIAMFSWWIFATGHIRTFGDILRSGFSPEFFIHAPKEIIGYIATMPFIEQLLNQLGIFLFFSFSIIGCFYLISKKYGNISSFNIAVAGITPLVVGFFSLIIGTYVLPERWWYFSQILLAISVSISFILLLNSIKNKYARPLCLFVLVLFLSFIMIVSPTANVDNPVIFPNSDVRLALTESEITAGTFFVENSVKYLSSDYNYFTNPSGFLTNNFGLNGSKIKSLDTAFLTKNFSLGNTVIVIRQDIVNKPFVLYGQVYQLNYNPQTYLEEKYFSRVYDSISVVGYK